MPSILALGASMERTRDPSAMLTTSILSTGSASTTMKRSVPSEAIPWGKVVTLTPAGIASAGGAQQW